MKSNIKAARNAFIVSAVAAVSYGIIANIYNTEMWFLPYSVGFIISLLIGLIISLFDLRREIPDVEKIREDVNKEIASIDHSIESLEAEMGQNMVIARELVKYLARDSKGVIRIRLSLSERGDLVRKIGNETLNELLGYFRIVDNGFGVYGEKQSLMAYRKFWQEIVRYQKRICNHDSEDIDLIARAIHSSGFRLWFPNLNPIAQDLLNLQKEFCLNGGKVIRLLISRDLEQPDEQYQEVIETMSKYGIEARFLHYPHDYDFDFIWVNPTEVGVKWYSGQHGKKLESCHIVELVGSDIKNRWVRLGRLSEERDGKFSSIPEGRNLVDRDEVF